MKKVCKGLIAINDVLDDRYQKLCDRYHDLELSHNRKKRALVKICNWCSSNLWRDDPIVLCLCENIVQVCEDALFSDGRCNCRPIVKQKKKGGAK